MSTQSDFEKSQSAKILACYGIKSEKPFTEQAKPADTEGVAKTDETEKE